MGHDTITAMSSRASLALMKFLSDLAKQLGVSQHVYVVGGAVRNFVINQPIKDIDVVIDSVALKGKDSAWFAAQVARAIPARTHLTTNQYGVALLHISGDWMLGDENLKGEDIEIANARTESYTDGGYTPTQVDRATIHEDVIRREFTFNTLLWRLHDLAEGPDKAEILDLTGCGLRDLQEGVMRCPVSPDKTFTDDPSRMLRAIKFLIKYGFALSLEVKRSIEKNKDKLRNIPPGHLSNMLINTFLREPTGKKALIEMQKLGLLDVVKEIAQTNKPFREALANWADSEARVEFLFDLMDFGLPAGKRLGFLTPEQQQAVRATTVNMTHQEAEHYRQVLMQPGKVLDTRALMLEFNLVGSAARTIQEVARQVLVESPHLMDDSVNLMARVRKGLAPETRVGSLLEPHPSGGQSFGGGDLYLADVVQDEFVHFTLASRAEQILTDGRLRMRPPYPKFGSDVVSAVSVHWGKFVPGVQTTHLRPSEADPLVAVKFKTATVPAYGYVEEVVWDRDVMLRVATVIPYDVGVSLVRGSKVRLGSQDQVLYRVASKLAKTFELNTGDPVLYGKFLNKPGTIKDFSKNDKGDPTVVIEPSKGGQDKEVKLFKLRYDEGRAPEAKQAGEDVRRKLANPQLPAQYHERLRALRAKVTYNKEKYLGNTADLWVAWFLFYEAGREWAAYVIDHLALPPKSAKNVELAVRLFSKSYGRGKGPPNIINWYEDNADKLYLLDEARSWPERSEESGVFDVGPFTVHDTIQAKPQDLAKAKDIIERAVKAARGAGVPGLNQMIYGQLFLVGQLGRRNWAAWYMPAKDTIYLRPGVQGSSNDESARHLVHELGHRLWHKKLDQGIKSAWISHHTKMTWSKPDRRLPEVGEVLAPIVNGKQVKVEQYDDKGQALLVDAKSGAPVGTVNRLRLSDWVRDADHKGKFPSLYAASDPQEHFCEALSLYAQGRLTGGNLEAFERIVLGVPSDAVARVAARFASDRIAEEAKYKRKKTVKTEDGDEAVVYEYSEKQVEHRNNEKAKRVEKLRGNLHKLQARVKKDLKSDDKHTRLCALAVGLMNDTYERVGNEESAKDGHVGVTGWSPEHIKFSDGKATITYVGKSGVKQEKVTKDADLIRVMKEAVKDKKKGETIFHYDDGKVDAAAVNEYLDGLGLGITAKDIRGLHANREMQERLKSLRSKGGKLPEDKKEREKKLKAEFKEALEGTAEAVGHEPSTLRSQYLVPGLEDAFLKDGTVMTKLDEKKAAVEDVIARRLAVRYLVATKTPAQKEDKDIRQMLKPDPKKKPIREDLRRNRMRTEDADLQGEGDKDLSLNYKHVGALAERWVRHLMARGAPEHKPGDIWQSEDKNWVAKNPDGQVHTFGNTEDAKAQAQAYAKGKPVDDGDGKAQAVGVLADALAKGDRKGIDKAKAALLQDHPELEAPLTEHLKAYDEANKALTRASIEAEGAKGKAKTEATRAATEAAARRDAAVEKIREMGKSSEAPQPPEAPKPSEAPKPEPPPPKAPEAPKPKPAEPGDPPKEKTPAQQEALRTRRLRTQVKFQRDRLEEHLGEMKDKLPPKAAEKVKRLLGEAEVSAELKAAEAAVEKAQAEVDEVEAGLPQDEIEVYQERVSDARFEGNTAEAKKAQAELDKLEKPLKDAQNRLKQAQKHLQKLQKDTDAATIAGKQKFLGEVAAALDVAEAAVVAEVQAKGITKSIMDRASKDPFLGVDWEDPMAVGRALAQQALNDKVLLNPAFVGGHPLSETPLDEEGLTGRAEAAFEQYQYGKPEVRKKAAENAAQQLGEFDPDSPQAKELNRIIDGLHLAMEMNGEQWEQTDSDGKLLREPLDEKMGLLARQMVEQGDSHVLLADSSDHHAVRESVRDAMGRLSDGELQAMAEDTPWQPLGDLLVNGIDGMPLAPDVAELLRGLVRDLGTNNLTTNQGLVNAVAGKKMPASNPLEVFQEAKEKFRQETFQTSLSKFLECLRKAKDPSECSAQGEGLKQMQVQGMAAALEKASKDMGVEVDPQNPYVAAVRHAAKTGDLSILDEPLRPAKSPAERQAEYVQTITDPVERERVQKMTPDEFAAMQEAFFAGSEAG